VHRPLQWLNRTVRPGFRAAYIGFLRRVIRSKNWGPPRGSFSDYEKLRNGKIEGRIVLETQGNPVLPDPSIILLCRRTQHLQQPWPILWSRHKKTRLLGPTLAHLNQQGQISEEAVYGRERLKTDPAWYAQGLAAPARLAGPWTSIIGQWLRNDRKSPYAHWLLDALPRLALLPEFPAAARILVPPHLFPSQIESLQCLGVWERCRPTAEQHLLIEDFYFSSPPSMIVCYSPYAVDWLRKTFLPIAQAQARLETPKRFFIRRTSFGRNMTNEEEVLDYFRKKGWVIVDTAKLGFLEQIHWFAQADAIFAIHGSGTANMVWCSPGCKFVELFAADYLAGDQEWIAQCVAVEYHFMVFPGDYKLDARVDLAQVEGKLQQLNLI
jgi:capsular polysaccharide biosynthesis protein